MIQFCFHADIVAVGKRSRSSGLDHTGSSFGRNYEIIPSVIIFLRCYLSEDDFYNPSNHNLDPQAFIERRRLDMLSDSPDA